MTTEVTTTLDPSFSAAIQFFTPAIMAALSVLAADAWKYVNTPLWDTSKFINTNIVPLGINTVLSIAIYYMLVYVPFLAPVLEKMTGEVLVVSAAGIFGFSQALIKGFLKPKKTVEDIIVTDEIEVIA